MLVRKYVGQRLQEYYAQPTEYVVGRSTRSSRLLSSLLGEWHWRRVLQRIYEEREGHWLTPVELFQPFYSRVLADFCTKYYEQIMVRRGGNGGTSKFEIFELGGGRGTNASLILSHIQQNKPDVYSSLIYTLVDSSPSLHKTQKELLDGPHADKVRFELKDLVDVAEGMVPLISKSNVPTVVMGLELLDNLPHDKIRGKSRHKIEQAEVIKDGASDRETFVPLSDPLLKMIVQTVPNYMQPPATCWVPSVACGVLHHAISQRPNLGLIMADFDWLPDPDLNYNSASLKSQVVPTTWAEGSPIVTDMEGQDHESYLTAPPHCDILFPTDFEKLASFVKSCLSSTIDDRILHGHQHYQPMSPPNSVVRVQKQSKFLERWGPEHVQATKNWLGQSPLLYDFINCSVLTISPNDDA